MDTQGLLEKHAETRFLPVGQDETGAFMVIEDMVIHVPRSDILMAEGQALKEIWPFVDKVKAL